MRIDPDEAAFRAVSLQPPPRGSAIVRLDWVREWKADGAGGAVVVLRDGTELPVSRRRLARVKALLRPPPYRD